MQEFGQEGFELAKPKIMELLEHEKTFQTSRAVLRNVKERLLEAVNQLLGWCEYQDKQPTYVPFCNNHFRSKFVAKGTYI